MLSTTRQNSARLLSVFSNASVAQSSRCAPNFPACAQNGTRTYMSERARKKAKDEEAVEKAARKIIKRMAQGERAGFTKKPSRGLKEKKQLKDAVTGRVPVHTGFHSESSTVFNANESRPEDLEAPGPDEGGADLIPQLHMEIGSFIEIRRGGHAQWGVCLGYEINYEGIEVMRTLLSSGETIKHPPRDVQFSLPGFAPVDLAMRAGDGKYADEKRPAETEARIALGRLLRALGGRIEQTSRMVERVADKLYEEARHPDGKTWSKISLIDAVDIIPGDKAPNLDLLFVLHQHFMNNPMKYIADTFEHRLSNTFAVRPLHDVQRMERVINWVRGNDPIINSFVAKARTIIDINKAQTQASRDEDPALIESKEGLPELNEADLDILDFCRYYLRQRRELQENPCLLTLPLILNKISPSYLPLAGHSGFRALEDLSVLAPWSNHVMHDVDLQLHEFTDTLDTPFPGRSSTSPVAPVTPVAVNDNRISGAKTTDGLDNMRHDFGDLPVYVVDDITAEELDDGLSIERATDGSDNVWLHIHIADPTSVLGPNDPLAVDASRRSATTYFPDATFPMLPPTDLSLGALGDNKDASMNVLSFSALVSPEGEILKHQIRAGIVRRVHVLRYDDVTRALGKSPIESKWPFGEPAREPTPQRNIPAETLPDFRLLQRVTTKLAKARVAKSDSVLWSQPRAVVSMKKDQILSDHDPRPLPRMYRGFPKVEYSVQLGTLESAHNASDVSRSLIAECMITAGRIASLFAQEHGVPMIYRSLARPVGIGADRYLPLLINRDPYQGSILYRDAVVQQLAQVSAQPMLTPAIHWQLGISAEEGYVRATSPLRRYLDMLCHWQIKSALHPKSMGVKTPFSLEDLKVMMLKQHLHEQARRRAGTTAVRLWAMRCIQNQIARGGHPTLRSLEGMVIAPPINSAHSLEKVVPVMVSSLGLPASVRGCDTDNPPPTGSMLKIEIERIELGYNPRLVVRNRRS